MVGWRTVATAGAFVLLGVGDVLKEVDVTPLVGALVGERSVGVVMVLMGLTFAGLRAVTRGAGGGARGGRSAATGPRASTTGTDMLATVVGWLVSLAGSPLIRAVADVLTAKANDDLAKEQLRVGADQALALSRLQAAEQTATLQAQVRLQEGRWGPTVVAGVLLFVVPSGIHYWAVVLDSIPLLGHAVGSWRIAALPAAFAAMEHSIIMSLFIVGGASMALGRIFSR